MSTFSKILLATDGSPNAKNAFRYTRDLALQNDALVILVHAYPPIPTYLGEPWGERLIESNIAEAERVANYTTQRLQEAGLDVVTEVLEGPAAAAILRVAEVRRCDLIVMGNRGHGELTSLLLGSVSHRVLAHARVPVLIVGATVATD